VNAFLPVRPKYLVFQCSL